MDLYTISALIFIVILAVIFYKDRKNVERQGIILIRRTKKGRQALTNLGRRFPRFWKTLGTVGVIFGFIISIYIVYTLADLVVINLVSEQVTPGLSLVLPSPGADTIVVPGVILVPFWYWIISIALLILVHEGMHGIMSAMEKVKIKSMGWGLLAIIPIAFVEPDEKKLDKKPAWPQLRVFAGGSFANFLLAGLCILIIISMSGMFVTGGVVYSAIVKDYPAGNANLTGVIVGINDYQIKELNDLKIALAEAGENQAITVTTAVGNELQDFSMVTKGEPRINFTPSLTYIIFSLIEHPIPGTVDFLMGTGNPTTWTQTSNAISMWEWTGSAFPWLEQRAADRIVTLESQMGDFKRPGYMGIMGVSTLTLLKPGLEGLTEPVIFIQGLLFWLFLINFGVGAANLLPIGPLDGGRMWTILFKSRAKKRWKGIMKVISYATLALLIINFAFWFGL